MVSFTVSFVCQAVRLLPSEASTFTAIGLCYGIMGLHEEAIEALHNSLSLHRDQTVATTLLNSLMEMVNVSCEILFLININIIINNSLMEMVNVSCKIIQLFLISIIMKFYLFQLLWIIGLSVTGEVYCFSRRQLIFSFGRRVIYYHLKGLWEYIPKLIPSVCTTILKRIAGLCFYRKCLMLYFYGFVSTSSTNVWKAYYKFRIIGRKPKNIQTNSKVWILIKVQCVVHQWIWLDKLYKLMEFFF